MIEVPVYVPSQRGSGRDRRMGEHLASVVAPRSAIVGMDAGDALLPDMLVVYYEGNTVGACNMVTFADRAMHAYYRMRDHYPTVAMMAVPKTQVVQSAILYPEYGTVEVRDVHDLIRLARWLQIDMRDRAALARELLSRGTRPQVRT